MVMSLSEFVLNVDGPLTPELELLKRVRELHQKTDAKISTLTHDFRAHRFYPRRINVQPLQLHVHSKFIPPVPNSGETPGTPGKWTLLINATDNSTGTPHIVNLSNYFRKISIELDPRLYSDSIVEWTCFQKDDNEVNTLEISRTGTSTHSVRIKLQPSHAVDRFTITQDLQGAIGPYLVGGGTRTYSKPDIIMAMWEYIKLKNLVKADDCRVVVFDPTLAQLFKCSSLAFSSIVVALGTHLTAAPAMDFEYEVKLDDGKKGNEDDPQNKAVFEVDVSAVDEVEKSRDIALRKWEELLQEQQKELDLLHQQQVHILHELETVHRKREWMLQFSQDPVRFLTDIQKSQAADQLILIAESETDEINIPHPAQFSQPWVREIVSDLLVVPSNN